MSKIRAMKITINPKYNSLESFVKKIPSVFDTEGTLIYKARNEIKVFETAGLAVNVKSYKIPIFINRIAYTFFRLSKTRRSYEYALKLLSLGVNTPYPIAYIEEKKCALLRRSYYICEHTPLDGNMRDVAIPGVPFESVRDLSIAFGKYTAFLHKKGVLHIDYSPGNILYKKRNDGTFDFSIIDINRMKFCKVDYHKGCKNFCRMWADDEFFIVVAQAYAEEMGYNPAQCTKDILKYREKEWGKREKKKNFFNFFKSLFKNKSDK